MDGGVLLFWAWLVPMLPRTEIISAMVRAAYRLRGDKAQQRRPECNKFMDFSSAENGYAPAAVFFFKASRHSGEGWNPRFVLAMDSGLRRNDDSR